MTVEWVEVTARTVEDAKDKALDYLGVDESQAEFEVVEEPRTGLFGRLKGEARVRARVQPTQPRPKFDRRDRRKRKPAGERATAPQEGAASGRTAASGESRDRRPSRQPVSEGSSVGSSEAADIEAVAPGAAQPGEGRGVSRREGAGRSRRPRGQRTPTDRSSGGARSDDESQALPAQEEFAEVTEDARQEVNEEALAREVEAAEVFLRGLLDAFGVQGGVEVNVQEDEARELRVTGKDLGLLIGPRGGTIDAVQELTRLAARRNANGRGEARIRVDVGGYRERRREALARFARDLAEEVARSGVQKVLEPMSSPDRKVVHDAAGEVAGVATLSEGEEPRRRVVIVARS